MKTQYGRYMLLIKQCVQLAGYQEEDQDEQMIMMIFSDDNQSRIGDVAKQLQLLQSNTQITIYDQVTGKKRIVQ